MEVSQSLGGNFIDQNALNQFVEIIAEGSVNLSVVLKFVTSKKNRLCRLPPRAEPNENVS